MKLAITSFGLAAALLSTTATATIVDLTNSDTGTVNSARFDFMAQQPTGTGVIKPFLRVQANGSEQGYNTSGSPLPFDDKAGIWTHDLRFSDLQQSLVSLDGTQYYKLLLDVNEPNGSRSLISLESLQIYTSATGSQTTLNVSSLGVLRYDLDAGGDSTVIIDAARNHGSGSGDIYAYLPVANFAGTNPSDFIYLFSRFGDSDDLASGGGFEEWSVVTNVAPVPEMNALFPIVGLVVAVGSTHVLRRRKMGPSA